MKLKIILPVAMIGFVGLSVFVYFKFCGNVSKEFGGNFSPKDIQSEIQRRGEERFRQKLYVPLIEVYKGMLEKFPDNLDLKKKLAFAYFGAEEYAKAKPLLEEVAKTNLVDDEVKRELEYIKSLK